MINISLNDPQATENAAAILYLKKTGLYTDEEIQRMYESQVKKDAEVDMEEGER